MRIYAYIVGALILVGALAYWHHLNGLANRTVVAERSLADFKAAQAARDKQVADAQVRDDRRRAELSQSLATVTAQLNTLRANPPKEIIHYVKSDGQPTAAVPGCPMPRLDVEFVRDYNAASAASVSDPH